MKDQMIQPLDIQQILDQLGLSYEKYTRWKQESLVPLSEAGNIRMEQQEYRSIEA